MRRRSFHLIDLTPMIDILFTVLLFFLLTQNIPLNSFNLAIPETQKDDGSSVVQNKTTLHIFPEKNTFAINSQKFNGVEQLKVHLSGASKTDPMTIIVDSTSQASNLVSVMEILNELNFSQVNIITQK